MISDELNTALSNDHVDAFIPKGWKTSKVGIACKIHNNLRLPLSTEVREKKKGEFPYFGPTGILGSIDEFRVEGRYALIGEDGDHFLKWKEKQMTLIAEGRFNVNNHAHLIGDGPECLVDWFYFYFQHRDLFKFLTRQGAGRYKLTKAALEQLPILVPPMEQQKKIIEILSTCDRGIESFKNLIRSSEAKHRWTKQQLLSEAKRKRKWKTVRLGDVITERKEKSSAHDQFPAFTSARQGLCLQSDYFNKQVTSKNNEGYKIIRQNDFTFRSMSDDGIFVFNQLRSHKAGIISPAYGVFFASGVSDRFLYFSLSTSAFANQLKKESQGGTRVALRFSGLAELEIDIPDEGMQLAISETLDTQLLEIGALRALLGAYERKKRFLLQNLINGRMEVTI